jgi:hypothetical protein
MFATAPSDVRTRPSRDSTVPTAIGRPFCSIWTMPFRSASSPVGAEAGAGAAAAVGGVGAARAAVLVKRTATTGKKRMGALSI